MGNLFILLIAICFLKNFTESASSENKDTDNVELEAVPSPSPEMVRKPYDTKFDNIDIDDLLKNDRLLKNYVKCLEYEGPCTPDGKMLRGECDTKMGDMFFNILRKYVTLKKLQFKNFLDPLLNRYSARRIVDELREVFREAEVRVREGYSLFHRRAKGILGRAGEDL